MGVYETKKNYFDKLMATYEQQYAILDQYQTMIAVQPDPKTRSFSELQKNSVEAEIARLEAELAKAEAELEKWAKAKAGAETASKTPEEKFNPPPKIYVEVADKKSLPQTATPVDTEDQFDMSKFAGVAVEQGELEALVSARAKYVEPILFANGMRKSIMAVGRVEVKGEAFGTASLIAKNKILTNWHVVRDPKYIPDLTVRFGHYFKTETELNPGVVYKVSKILAWSNINQMDYALLEIEGDPSADGFNTIEPGTTEPIEDRIVNILHHPKGVPMKLSIQDNWVKKVQGDRVLYLTNTEPGSSGAPVFNDRWEFVALHHSGKPFPPGNFPAGIEANEGIVMRNILDDIVKQGATV